MEGERTVPMSGEAKVPSQAELAAVKGRFAEYTKWMMTSPNGIGRFVIGWDKHGTGLVLATDQSVGSCVRESSGCGRS